MTPEPEPVVLPTLTREQWLLAVGNLVDKHGGLIIDAAKAVDAIHGPLPPEPSPYWRCDSAVDPVDVGLSVSVPEDSQTVRIAMRFFGTSQRCAITSADARKGAQALFLAARYVEASR